MRGICVVEACCGVIHHSLAHALGSGGYEIFWLSVDRLRSPLDDIVVSCYRFAIGPRHV